MNEKQDRYGIKSSPQKAKSFKLAKKRTVTYEVYLTLGTKVGSSTLTPLVIDIHGDEGSTGDLKLSEFGRFLKQGKTYKFRFEDHKPVGTITHIFVGFKTPKYNIFKKTRNLKTHGVDDTNIDNVILKTDDQKLFFPYGFWLWQRGQRVKLNPAPFPLDESQLRQAQSMVDLLSSISTCAPRASSFQESDRNLEISQLQQLILVTQGRDSATRGVIKKLLRLKKSKHKNYLVGFDSDDEILAHRRSLEGQNDKKKEEIAPTLLRNSNGRSSFGSVRSKSGGKIHRTSSEGESLKPRPGNQQLKQALAAASYSVGRTLHLDRGLVKVALSVAQTGAESLKVLGDHGVSAGKQVSRVLSGNKKSGSIDEYVEDDQYRRVLSTEVIQELLPYYECAKLKVLCLTWNVGESLPSPELVEEMLGGRQDDADIVVVGLQEIEMGVRSVTRAWVKSKMKLTHNCISEIGDKKKVSTVGTLQGKWWQHELAGGLNGYYVTSVMKRKKFSRIGWRQLSGILLSVYVKQELEQHVSEIMLDHVASGVLNQAGNKGGVGLSCRLFGYRFMFVTSHLAAHQGGVKQRNEDFKEIYQNLKFSPASSESDDDYIDQSPSESDACIIWLGDLNYRIDMSREEVMAKIREKQFSHLLHQDQLVQQRKGEHVFKGFGEGDIDFPPTYKFDVNDPSPMAYDSGEKNRIPAYCDRILYRGNKPFANLSSCHAYGCLPHKQAVESGQRCLNEVVISCATYAHVPTITSSDHKPVYAILDVDIPYSKQEHFHRQSTKGSSILEQRANGSSSISEV